MLLKKFISENLREIFKLEYLEEQFSKFDEQAQEDLERVAEILEPENVRKELVKYFGHIDEQMKQFSADIKQWDGENQKVKKIKSIISLYFRQIFESYFSIFLSLMFDLRSWLS